MKHSKHPGFTLIEVMVVVAIIALLVTIALPSYQEFVRRGQVPEAMVGLSDFRIKLEQYYQDNRSYGGSACADGANPPGWASFQRTDARYFSYACVTANSGQGYRLTATSTPAMALSHAYQIDHDNRRVTVTFKGQTVNKGCWLVKGQEC